MANKKIKIEENPSVKATGLNECKTIVGKSVHGVRSQAHSLNFKVNPKTNTILIEGILQEFNYKGVKVKSLPSKIDHVIRDVGEIWEYEINEKGLEIEGTRQKVKDENLMATRWNNREVYEKNEKGEFIKTTVGNMIFGDIIAFVSYKENIM